MIFQLVADCTKCPKPLKRLSVHAMVVAMATMRILLFKGIKEAYFFQIIGNGVFETVRKTNFDVCLDSPHTENS